jgi:hypothetical protein
MSECRCRIYFFQAFQHLLIIFQHHIARKTPSAAFYRGAGVSLFRQQSGTGTGINKNADAGTYPLPE